jgi:PAS domain S-box-containing protein
MERIPSLNKKTEEEFNVLSIALEQSANVVVITDPNGTIEYVNHAFTLITGYTSEEALGQNPRILKSGYQPRSFYENLWKTISNGNQWQGEFQNIAKNKEIFWENATITPVKNKDGKIIHYIAIKENITSRKQAEDALKLSEEKYRSLIANIPGVIYRCAFDKNWTIYYISNAIEDLAGRKAEDFINNQKISYADIIHRDDRERVMDTVTIGIENFQQYSIEYRIVTQINTIKWVSETGRPVFDQNGKVVCLDGVIFDITDRVHVLEELKKAKNLAEEANKAKSEFLANISHEIRTPLNSVLGFTELLEDTITQETEKQYLDAIRTSGKNLLTLINDLLDLSKIEAGKLSLHYDFLNLKKLLEEIRQIFSLRLTQKNLRYVEVIDADFPLYIFSDESRLRQVLINLVGNAIKFTHDNGQITITAEFERGAEPDTINLKLSVRDTGIGIPKEAYNIIFESFRQYSHMDTRRYEGTGLGLPITKKLVEALKGSIFVDSTVDKGSNFMIVLPNVIVREEASSHAMKPTFKKTVKAKNKILLEDFTGRFLADYKDFMPMYRFIEFFSFYRDPDFPCQDIVGIFVVTGLDHSIINQKLHYFKEISRLKDLPLVLLSETLNMQVHEEAIKIADLVINMPSEIHSMMRQINQLLKITEERPAATDIQKVKAERSPNDNIRPLLDELQNSLYIQWESFQTKQPLKDIRSFANRIREIGVENQVDLLFDYGNSLIASLNEFNIETLREGLAKFPGLVNKLKGAVNESGKS